MEGYAVNVVCECLREMRTYVKDGHAPLSRCEYPECQHYGTWFTPPRVKMEPATPSWTAFDFPLAPRPQ
jgi:hypothetical protein